MDARVAKNPFLDLWMTSASQIAGFWLGYAASAMGQRPRRGLEEAPKAAGARYETEKGKVQAPFLR